jgi:hypothetical protein
VVLFEEKYVKKSTVIDVAGRKIGVTAVLGDDELEKLSGFVDSDLKLLPVDQTLPVAIEQLKSNTCDYYILIANTSLEESRTLARRYPMFDLVISANGIGEPTNVPELLDFGNHVTSLIQVGSKGMHVGVLGFYANDERLMIRYQRVPLDARFDDSDEMKVVFLEYQRELGNRTWDELKISPKEHPTGRQYVGSEACLDCHEYAYTIWEEGHGGDGGPHFRATLDLTEPGERVWVTREKDPECLSCHVTGWNPQGYFPYQTGYLKLDDEVLHGNGCENCHGPGKDHVDAENAKPAPPKDELERLRKEMVVTLETARKELCVNCHDLDNSPDFSFDEYWPEIEHNSPE